MEAKWHYNHDGVNHGPITGQQLKAFANDGTVTRDTLIWKEGMAEWLPAKRIKDLFPATTAPPPPAPNQPPPLPAAASTKAFDANTAVVTVKKVAADVRRTYHLQRIAIIAAASFGILATFAPWVSLPIIGTIHGTAGDGWITLCLFIPAIVLAFQGDKLTPLTGGKRFGAAIPAGIAALIGLAKIGQFKSKMAEAGSDNPFAAAFSNAVQLRYGIFLLVVAGVGVCLAAWLLEKRKDVTIDD